MKIKIYAYMVRGLYNERVEQNDDINVKRKSGLSQKMGLYVERIQENTRIVHEKSK